MKQFCLHDCIKKYLYKHVHYAITLLPHEQNKINTHSVINIGHINQSKSIFFSEIQDNNIINRLIKTKTKLSNKIYFFSLPFFFFSKFFFLVLIPPLLQIYIIKLIKHTNCESEHNYSGGKDSVTVEQIVI